jgi:hypothetical protein
MAIDIIGSREPARNGPGQNGDSRASSLTPNQKSRIKGFMPDVVLPTTNEQLRSVSAKSLPVTYGQRPLNTSVAKVPGKTDHRKS